MWISLKDLEKTQILKKQLLALQDNSKSLNMLSKPQMQSKTLKPYNDLKKYRDSYLNFIKIKNRPTPVKA